MQGTIKLKGFRGDMGLKRYLSGDLSFSCSLLLRVQVLQGCRTQENPLYAGKSTDNDNGPFSSLEVD